LDIVEEALASLFMMDGGAIFLEWLDKLVDSPPALVQSLSS
jgi:hypothetical protein